MGSNTSLPSIEGEIPPGTVIGEFQIECTLGRGGMGSVYGAVHAVIGKRGAIKVLRHDLCTNQDEVARFIQEARAVNQIGHANIVDVFAFGALPDGRSYLVMEWLHGESLRKRMNQGPLSRSQIYELMSDIVNALEAAHAKGIIHRDLKPDNVFLVETPGDRRRAKLLDFGVAKLTAEGKNGWTRMGAMIGTPQYIAPEQARGEAVRHSDIYALGIMLFELLVGRPPFEGASMVEIVSMHMMDPPPRMSTRIEVSKKLDDLVDAMLAKDGADRPSFAAIRAGLEELRAKPSLQTGVRTASVRKRSSHGPKIALALGLGVVAALVAFAVVRGMRDDPAVVASVATTPPPHEPAPVPVPPPKPTSSSSTPSLPPSGSPVATSGTLVVLIKYPRGMVLEVDGEPGKPNQVIELPAGPHKVVVMRNGKKISEQSVDITAGNQTKIEPKLRTPITPIRPPDLDDGLRIPR